MMAPIERLHNPKIRMRPCLAVQYSIYRYLRTVFLWDSFCFKIQPSNRSQDESGRCIPTATGLQCIRLPHAPESTPSATATVSSSTPACRSVWRPFQRLPTAPTYCSCAEHVSGMARTPRQPPSCRSPATAGFADRSSKSSVFASDAINVPVQRLPCVCTRSSTVHNGISFPCSCSSYTCVFTSTHSF